MISLFQACFGLLLLCGVALGREAIVLGSSGLVGSLVLEHLVSDPLWDAIHVVVRRPGGNVHDKVHEVIVPNLKQMETNPDLLKLARRASAIDSAIVTLGVNDGFGWTAQEFVDVDVLLPSIFAKYCHERLGVKYISLLSMVGAERGNP